MAKLKLSKQQAKRARKKAIIARRKQRKEQKASGRTARWS